MDTELTNKIRRGKIDINNQSLFFSILIKGMLQALKKDISVRGVEVPHFILNTGDDTMYLGVKGQDASVEPLQISNEEYVYNIKPRCIVQPKGINLVPDQLTSPYSNGVFQYDDGENITSFTAEFRRYPITMVFDLNYYLDTYTDALELVQQVITKLAFIRTFSVEYMGQHIRCSYTVPEAMDAEYNMNIEGNTSEVKDRKISLSLTVETYIPVYDVRTAVQCDHYIRDGVYNIKAGGRNLFDKDIVNPRDELIEYLEQKIREYETKDRELSLLLREILRKINEKELYYA